MDWNKFFSMIIDILGGHRMKILMIGARNSGKTTYMASAFGILQKPHFGFSVGAINSDDKTWFNNIYTMIREGGYPDPTDKKSSYAMDLLYSNEKMMSFSWLDFAGGLIYQTKNGESALAPELKSSDGLMVFFDAKALLDHDDEATQLSSTVRLALSELIKREDEYFISIVLTKWDSIPSGKTVRQVIGSDLFTFLETMKLKPTIKVSVIPVSCVGEFMINVDYPLLFQLNLGLKIEYDRHMKNYQKLLNEYHDAENTKKRLEQEAEEYRVKEKAEDDRAAELKSGGIFHHASDWVYSRWNGFKTDKEIAKEHTDKGMEYWRMKRNALELAEAEAKTAESKYKKYGEILEKYNKTVNADKKLDEYLASYKIALPPPVSDATRRNYADKLFSAFHSANTGQLQASGGGRYDI